MAKKQQEKRIFRESSFSTEGEASISELKDMLRKERRREENAKIKHIIDNKIFAYWIFGLCLGLNAFFAILGILNYLEIIK